jgi:hypothetical protein
MGLVGGFDVDLYHGRTSREPDAACERGPADDVDHIMTRLKDGISYSKYMNLYTVAYNYCVSSRMHGNLDSSVGLGGRSECPFSLSLSLA